jgi:hypothetical protein
MYTKSVTWSVAFSLFQRANKPFNAAIALRPSQERRRRLRAQESDFGLVAVPVTDADCWAGAEAAAVLAHYLWKMKR